MPSAIFRSANSTTMIAPSTSMPTERISENITIEFSVMPLNHRKAMPRMNEVGMAKPTRRPERMPSAATTTIITSTTASTTAWVRLWMVRSTQTDWSCV